MFLEYAICIVLEIVVQLCCYGVDGLLHHGVDEGVEFLLGEANVKPAPHPLHRAAAVVEAGQLGARPHDVD